MQRSDKGLLQTANRSCFPVCVLQICCALLWKQVTDRSSGRRWIVSHLQKTAFIIEHDFVMASALSDRVIVYSGTPGVECIAETPLDIEDGFNKFLKQLDVTFRRDEANFRPRVNKKNSSKDKDQKSAGKYFIFDVDEDPEEVMARAKLERQQVRRAYILSLFQCSSLCWYLIQFRPPKEHLSIWALYYQTTHTAWRVRISVVSISTERNGEKSGSKGIKKGSQKRSACCWKGEEKERSSREGRRRLLWSVDFCAWCRFCSY